MADYHLTPTYGIPYFDEGFRLRELDEYSTTLAAAIEAGLTTGATVSIVTGVATISGSATSTGSIYATVTFGTAFTEAPAVFAIKAGVVTGEAGLTVESAYQVTTTSFRLRLRNWGAGQANVTDLPVQWLAIGRVAA